MNESYPQLMIIDDNASHGESCFVRCRKFLIGFQFVLKSGGISGNEQGADMHF